MGSDTAVVGGGGGGGSDEAATYMGQQPWGGSDSGGGNSGDGNKVPDTVRGSNSMEVFDYRRGVGGGDAGPWGFGIPPPCGVSGGGGGSDSVRSDDTADSGSAGEGWSEGGERENGSTTEQLLQEAFSTLRCVKESGRGGEGRGR